MSNARANQPANQSAPAQSSQQPGTAPGRGSRSSARYCADGADGDGLLPDEARDAYKREISTELALVSDAFIVAMNQAAKDYEAIDRANEALRYQVATVLIGVATPYLATGIARVAAGLSARTRAFLGARRLERVTDPRSPDYHLAHITKALDRQQSPAMRAVGAHFDAKEQAKLLAKAESHVTTLIASSRRTAAHEVASALGGWDRDDFLIQTFKAHQDWISNANNRVQQATREDMSDAELLAFRMAYDHSAHPVEAFYSALMELCERFKREVQAVGYREFTATHHAVRVWKIDPGEPTREGVAIVSLQNYQPGQPMPTFVRWVHKGLRDAALARQQSEHGHVRSFQHSDIYGLDWSAPGSPMLDADDPYNQLMVEPKDESS